MLCDMMMMMMVQVMRLETMERSSQMRMVKTMKVDREVVGVVEEVGLM